MDTEVKALTRTRLATRVALVLFAAGCQWETQPGRAGQGLSHTEGPESEDCADEGEWETPYGCGETFAAQLWGECNDCEDLGCTRPDEGRYECACYHEGEVCLFDDGGDPTTQCGSSLERCDCGDGEGRVYVCECEGRGDDCGCMVPREPPYFDYEFECEHPAG